MNKNEGFATTLIPVDKIKPPLFQSRTESLEENLDELVDSIKAHGLLEPIIIRIDKEQQPELVSGMRRVKASEKAGLTMIPVVVKELTDEEVLQIQGSENLNRNDLTDKEKTMLVSEWAKLGYKAQAIAEKIHKSYSFVVKYLPDKFKNENKAEAGRIGGQAKAEGATQRVAEQRGLCDNCKVTVSEEDLKPWNGNKLCGRCYVQALDHPAQFHQRLEPPKIEAKTIEPPFKDTWEYRKGQMQVPHSKQELEFVKLAQDDSMLQPVVTDRAFYAVKSVPDAFLVRHNVVVYVDGEVHQGREDRDDKLREMIAKTNNVKVFVFKIGEGKPADWIKLLKEKL